MLKNIQLKNTTYYPGDLSEFDLENTSGFIINDISLAFIERTLSSDKLKHSSNDLRKVATSLTLWEMEHVNSPFCKWYLDSFILSFLQM